MRVWWSAEVESTLFCTVPSVLLTMLVGLQEEYLTCKN